MSYSCAGAPSHCPASAKGGGNSGAQSKDIQHSKANRIPGNKEKTLMAHSQSLSHEGHVFLSQYYLVQFLSLLLYLVFTYVLSPFQVSSLPVWVSPSHPMSSSLMRSTRVSLSPPPPVHIGCSLSLCLCQMSSSECSVRPAFFFLIALVYD